MGTVGFHRFDKDAVRAAIDGASAIFGVEAGQDAPRATPSRRSRRAGRAGRRRSMGLPSHIHAQRGSAARAHGSSASVAAAASTDDPQEPPNRPPDTGAKAGNPSHDSRRRPPQPPADSSLNDQRNKPAARLKRETHPLRRADSIMHLGLLYELGLGRPQGSPEARAQSAVSQVCRQQN